MSDDIYLGIPPKELTKEGWDPIGIKSINEDYKWQKADDFLREYRMLVEQQSLFAKDIPKLINFIFDQGYLCTFGEAFRTHEQALIYARQGKGIIDSLHCSRLAIDINLFDKNFNYLQDFKDYESIGIYWESLDTKNRWGGRFKPLIDSNHFERKANV